MATTPSARRAPRPGGRLWRPTLSQRHSRSRPRQLDFGVVGHHEHDLVRATIILDVRNASPIGTRWPLLPLLTLRPLRSLRAFRTDEVHEQGPGSILLAKQVAAGRVQVDVAVFP